MSQRLGIVAKAEKWRHSGLFYPMILWYTLLSGRFFELFISGWPLLLLPFLRRQAIQKATHVDTFIELFKVFDLGTGFLVARDDLIATSGTTFVAGEYGQPGARILVRQGSQQRIYSPYSNDKGVWHLHAMLPVGGNRYLVSTGDRKKYLDVISIDLNGCEILERIHSHIGGHTAMCHHGDAIWLGSDFSERANYVCSLGSRKKYYLPTVCLKHYVVHLESLDADRLLIITARLGTSTGYALIFSVETKRFLAGNPIAIVGQTISGELARKQLRVYSNVDIYHGG